MDTDRQTSYYNRGIHNWRIWEKPTVWAAVHILCCGRDGWERTAYDLPNLSHVSIAPCRTTYLTKQLFDRHICGLLLNHNLLLMSSRNNLTVNTHFISCPCSLHINTEVWLLNSCVGEKKRASVWCKPLTLCIECLHCRTVISVLRS